MRKPTRCNGWAFGVRPFNSSVAAARRLELDLERLANHFLPLLLLVGGQRLGGLGVRFLGQRLHFGHDRLEVTLGVLEQLPPFLLHFLVDRLELLLLLTGDVWLLLD